MRPNAFITKEAVIDRLLHHWMYKQPTSCLWSIIGLTEPLSDDVIEKALKLLIDAVPILSARLKTRLWHGYWEFVETGNIKRLITRKKVSGRNEANRLLKEIIRNPIAADNPPLIRITSIDLPDDHYLILQVHHNVMDGEGSKQLFSLYTINVRRWLGQPEGTFANMSAIYPVVANSDDLVDVHKATKVLKRKFDKSKQNFGLKELWDILSFKIQPELLARILSFLIIRAVKKTHALTNIGIIPESAGNFGRLQAKSYSLIAPPMPSPNLLFTASSYKNNLTVHCSFNETHMKPETIRNFMRQFRDNMLAFVGQSQQKAL